LFKPLSLYIGLRYTRAKRKNHFISFISLASMIGIALGVAVLITVLSVMNGFDTNIKEKVFSMAPQVTISTVQGRLSNWQSWQTKLVAQEPDIKGSAPFVDGQGLLRFYNQVSGTEVQGILPSQESNVNELAHKMVSGKLTDLKAGGFGIVLGQGLANTLGVGMGDKVMLFTPNLTVTPAGVSPRFKRFTVVGIFSVGNGFGFDQNLSFIQMQDAQALFMMGNDVTGLNIKINNLYDAPNISNDIQVNNPTLAGTDWTQTYGALFKAIAIEKNMMFLILILIIAVAAFNLVSGLVMVVTDKQADIAILRTMGATPGMILRTFIVQGAMVGIFGTLLGLIGGLFLASNVTEIVTWIQQVLHQQIFQSSVYYMDTLPSQIESSDIIRITSFSLILSLVATIYPAWRASKVQPAEALRYE
jgi:lipoprotein-releasing system permease protein